jgi:hypothetical protein
MLGKLAHILHVIQFKMKNNEPNWTINEKLMNEWP